MWINIGLTVFILGAMGAAIAETWDKRMSYVDMRRENIKASLWTVAFVGMTILFIALVWRIEW